jgi:hypothetical protein
VAEERVPVSEIVLAASRVAEAKRSEMLGPVLAVSRAANAITVARGPLLYDADDFSPLASRERFSAMFLVAAVLYEALETAQQLGEHFEGQAPYEEGFGQLLENSKIAEFRRRSLKKFRDKGVFHFDSGFFRRAASQMEETDAIVGIHTTAMVKDTYISLSDDLMFDHILGPFRSNEQKVQIFEEFSDMLVETMNEFLKSAHQLVPYALYRLGAFSRRGV